MGYAQGRALGCGSVDAFGDAARVTKQQKVKKSGWLSVPSPCDGEKRQIRGAQITRGCSVLQ